MKPCLNVFEIRINVTFGFYETISKLKLLIFIKYNYIHWKANTRLHKHFCCKNIPFLLRKTVQSVRLGVIKKYKLWNWGCKVIILNFKKACFRNNVLNVLIRLILALTAKRQVPLNLAIINNVVIFPKLRFKEFNFWNGDSLSLTWFAWVCQIVHQCRSNNHPCRNLVYFLMHFIGHRS